MMTQPPSPGDMARVDQAHADASRFVDQMLTTGVTELQRGVPLYRLFVVYGGTLHANREQFSAIQMRVLVSVAVGRLAVLHHAVEQLAHEWIETATRVADRAESALKHGNDESATRMDAEAIQVRACAAKLRKLVDL